MIVYAICSLLQDYHEKGYTSAISTACEIVEGVDIDERFEL